MTRFLAVDIVADRNNKNSLSRKQLGNNWRFLRNNYPATTNSDVLGSTTFYPAASLTGAVLAPYPGITAGIPFVALPDISSGVIAVPTGVGPGSTVPFKYRRGYIHSYNLTLQREFAGFVAEAAYVGTRGIRTLTNENINAAPINGGNAGRLLYPVANKNWGDINSLSPDTNSYYDALQTKLTRRSFMRQDPFPIRTELDVCQIRSERRSPLPYLGNRDRESGRAQIRRNFSIGIFVGYVVTRPGVLSMYCQGP